MKNLLKVKIRQLKNSFQSGEKGKFFIVLALGLFFLLVLGFFTQRIFGYLYQLPEFPLVFKLFIAEKLMTMIFLTLFSMLLLSSFLASLDIFYLSRDLEFLISSPMSLKTIFNWKMVEVIVISSLMVVFFSFPVLFSYCFHFASSLFRVAEVLLVFMLFVGSGVLLGIIFGLIIPFFFSVKRLQPVLSVFSIIIISSIVIFLRLLRPERFLNPDEIDNVLKYMGSLDIKFFYYFPFYWISRSLTHVANGKGVEYLKIVLFFAVVLAVLFFIIVGLRKKIFLQLFDKLSHGGRGSYRSSWRHRLFTGEYGALWNKEVKTFLRTPAQWSQLLIIAALVAVFVINMRMIPLPHPSVKNFVAYLNIGLTVFIVAGLNSRFSLPTIPLEGPGLVHLLSSPMEKDKFVFFKWLFYLSPQLVIGLMLLWIGDLSLHFDGFTRVFGLLFLLPAITFLTTLAHFFGMKIKELSHLSPEHVIVSKNGIAYMLWSMIYIVLALVFFARPVFLFYYAGFTRNPVPYAEIVTWFTAFLVINFLAVLIFFRRCRTMWRRREI